MSHGTEWLKLGFALATAALAVAQSTQGLITGQVRDHADHKPLPGVWISYCRFGPEGIIGKPDKIKSREVA